MLREREQRTADNFGITEQVEDLKAALLAIQGVVSVEFDLDGFWDNMNQVIILTGYAIPFNNYFTARRQMVDNVISTAVAHRLTRTKDRIEDYGAHLYFVFSCDKRWNTNYPV